MAVDQENNGDHTAFHATTIKQSLDELIREVNKAKSSNTPLPPEIAERLVEVCVLFTNILKTETVKTAIRQANNPEAIELIEEARRNLRELEANIDVEQLQKDESRRTKRRLFEIAVAVAGSGSIAFAISRFLGL